MGQKVHPLGFRLGVFEDWHAHWFAKKNYGAEVIEDLRLRRWLKKRLNDIDIAKVVIEKAGKNIRIIVHSSRPGVLIGKKGQGIDQLRADILKEFKKNAEVSVQEVKNPDLHASLVAKNIAEQLSRRVGFKRAMKRAGFQALKSGAKGVKIVCSGRLGGAEIARSEKLNVGEMPLHTLRTCVDYALAESKTIYGIIGVKVWICKGEYR
ncbi:30S ribosomal protein S3 [Candidatus Dependentiae bacterium]|nr:MAG: 30S ribosomal protein S3 [Candidatus Dependentiae bacterium]